MEGALRNPVPSARVREGHEGRAAVRAHVERVTERLQPRPLLGRRQLAVGDVVDLPGEGVDGGDRSPLRAREHHDPVGEVARPPARQPLDLRVGLRRRHPTSAATAARASRAREGLGRRVKTS